MKNTVGTDKPPGSMAVGAGSRLDAEGALHRCAEAAGATLPAMDVHHLTADAEQFTANAYLVPGSATTLVDVGTLPDIADRIRTHVDTLDRVVLTHQHRDHVATLDAVCEAFDPAVAAFAPHPQRTEALADGDRVPIGDTEATVVHTPGHADDHVSLVTETACFSGDVVVYSDGAFDDGSFGRTDRPGQSRETLIESLRTLLDRLPESVTSLYAGHGPPFHADGVSVRDVMRRALQRAERRQLKYD
jgi:hydroxyacylglutathione hydrolase